MLRDEWLQIGYDKGIIDDIPESEFVNFETVYKMRSNTTHFALKPHSLDRIEVTYNRYYCGTEFVRLPVHTINEAVIYKFINGIILEKGNITEKELEPDMFFNIRRKEALRVEVKRRSDFCRCLVGQKSMQICIVGALLCTTIKKCMTKKQDTHIHAIWCDTI